MFTIDSVRSAARRSAWDNDGSNVSRYNIFGRTRSRSSQQVIGDEEDPPLSPSAVQTWPRSQHEGERPRTREGNAEGPSGSRDPAAAVEASDPGSATTAVGTERVPTEKKEIVPEDVSSGDTSVPKEEKDEAAIAAPVNGTAPETTAETRRRKRWFHHKSSEERPSLEHTTTGQSSKSKKHRKHIPIPQQIKAVLYPQWLTINWLLICVPVGIAIANVGHSIPPIAVFVVNFLAIVPLAGILSYATEEIAIRVGETLGGLLNASFGNAVELIVGIIALAKKEIIIVQTSLIGSILSNLLLVMGMSFFLGGINRIEQHFNMTVAQTAASMLALSVGALIIPTAFTWGAGGLDHTGTRDEAISRGTSIIMLLVYGCYLLFQLKSHAALYAEKSPKGQKRESSKKEKGAMSQAVANMGANTAAVHGGQAGTRDQIYQERQEEEEEEEPELSLWGALFTLCASTALVGVCAEYLVDSISEVTCEYHVSEYFVGLILLPIVGNAAEHATAVTVAIKDKMDLSIGVAVGSSMQIAMLVMPLMVILGWIIHADMTLVFDDFQIAIMFVSVLLVNYLIQDGKSHWMEGVLLIALYIIAAVSAWFYPKEENSCAPK